MQYKRPESVLVLVYTVDKQVLLMQRINPPHFCQSVAGSLEWGESKEQAATRELFEETGLNSDKLIDCNVTNRYLIYPMWRERYAPKTIENTEYVFRLELESVCEVELDEREHHSFLWLSAEQAMARVSSHTNRIAVEQWVK